VLFDLKTGKRRRFIQVVFGFLAFIFFISFVGFGIGSDVSGGIFDAIGLGGSGGRTDVSSQYEQQIEEAEDKLAADPKDPKALTDLARYRYLSGQENLDFDEETGVATITEEARGEWNAALDAWEKLLRTKPERVDPQVAGQMVCAYVPPLPLCQVQAPADALDLAGAAQTQRVLAEESGDSAAYAQLASFLYFDGDLKAGDDARDEAIAAANPGQRERVERELGRLRKDAQAYVKAQEQASQAGGAEGAPQLENPFGGLGAGGAGAGLPPAGP